MSRSNSQSTIAHQISLSAVHHEILLRVSRDPTIILLVLRVAEEHNALDLVTNSSCQLGDRAGDDGSTLTVLVESVCVVRKGGCG